MENNSSSIIIDNIAVNQRVLISIWSQGFVFMTNKILKRGFSIIRDINNNVIYKKKHAHKNGDIIIELSDGKIKAKIS